MKLKEVWIKGYKSIQDWEKLILDNRLIALTGKNGTGKTNLLEALRYALSQDASFTYHSVPKDFSYKIVLELSEEELKEIDDQIENKPENRRLEVVCDSHGDSLRANRIKSKTIVDSIKKSVADANTVLNRLKTNLSDYVELIKNTVNTEPISATLAIGEADLSAHSNYGTYNRKPTSFIVEDLQRAIQEVENIKKNIIADNDTLNFPQIYSHQVFLFGLDNVEVSLKAIDPVLSPFQKNYIQIDEKGIKEAIEQINAQTKSLSEKIQSDLTEFCTLCHKVDVLGNELNDAEDFENETLKTLRQRIDKAIRKKVYSLQNISSSLLFVQENERYQFYNGYQYLVHAFWRYDCPEEAERKIKESANKAVLRPDEIERFEKMLNNTLPHFEQGLIEKVTVESQNENMTILLEETSGAIIPLNQANLGRRWYFTYYFIKQCLQKGDVFLLDEPASFLHPDAQLEILAELKQLADNGIQVIYATHSPYMLPELLQSIRVVSIDEKGTHLNTLNNAQNYIDSLREQIGVSNLNDFLLRIGKPIIFVEGEQDKACLLAFMQIFGIESKNYEIYPCYGHPAVTMAWTSMKIGLKNFKVLLDYDNKEKPKRFLDTNPDFKSHLLELMNNGFVVFTSEDGTKKEIEDLFAGQDQDRYMSYDKRTQKKKVSRDKLQDMNPSSVENETKENFKKLFFNLGIFDLPRSAG